MNLRSSAAALDEVMMDRDRALEPTGPLIPLIIGCALFMQTLDVDDHRQRPANRWRGRCTRIQ